MIFALFLLMKNTSKSNLARKNICKYLAFQNSFTSQSNLAITDGRLLKSQNQFLLRLWCLESYEVDFLWPKLLNYQLMFCKSNFILWMSENFDWTKIFSLLNITFWTISKTFWYSQNVIGFPKHWLGLQKFWTLDFIASMGSNPWGSLIYITIDLLFHKSSMRHTYLLQFRSIQICMKLKWHLTKDIVLIAQCTVVESSTNTTPLIPSGPRDWFDMSV